MSATDYASLPVRLDPVVKARLERESSDREASINDVAVGILAEHYKVKFEGTGRRSPGARGSTTVMLRLPPRLYTKIHRDAQPPRTKSEVVERILCERFGLEYRSPRSRVAA